MFHSLVFTASIDVWKCGYRWERRRTMALFQLSGLSSDEQLDHALRLDLATDVTYPFNKEEVTAGYREYDPFKREPALFLAFSRLAPTEDAVLAFVDRYGWSYACKGVSSGPSFLEFRRLIVELRSAVDLFEAVSTRDEEALRRHVEWSREGLRWPSPVAEAAKTTRLPRDLQPWGNFTTAKKYRQGDLVGPASELLDFVIACHAYVTGNLCPARLPSGLVTYRMPIADMAAVLWIQFALAVAGEKQFRNCEHKECGKPFELSPGVNRPDRLFCSDSCRVQAHRKRRAAAERMYRLGKKPKEIAKATGTDLETVNKWLSTPKEK